MFSQPLDQNNADSVQILASGDSSVVHVPVEVGHMKRPREDDTHEHNDSVCPLPQHSIKSCSQPQSSRGEASAESTSPEPQESYQETSKYATWRKHTTHLYQQLAHIDLVWESPSVQFMPYMTVRDHIASQTILCGTRTGGAEQNYVQFFTVSLPADATALDDEDAGGGFCDATGEVGGYGRAPSSAGMKIERRMFHDGDVLAARYMHANPLLLATSSSDGNLYVFDWSRISLQSKPNKPERPRGPVPPNALSDNPSEEEKSNYYKRMKQIDDVAKEQQRWDDQREEGQHVVTLKGSKGPSNHVEWNTSIEGVVASGSSGLVNAWQVATLSKTDSRVVDPMWSATVDDDDATITDTKFSWDDPFSLFCTLNSGALVHGDTRRKGIDTLLEISAGLTTLSIAPSSSQLVAAGCRNGTVAVFDMRKMVEPVVTEKLHDGGDVTVVQWSPHFSAVLATGGEDGNIALYDTKRCHLLFKHAGHTDVISDMNFSWQDDFKGQMVSADQNSIIVWRPRDVFLELSEITV